MTGRRLAGAVTVVGVLVLLAGTFLPWLVSGRARRNSYAGAGVLQRLLGVHGAAGTALSAWPFLGLWFAACALVALLGARRLAAALAVVGALTVGALAIAVLNAPARFGVSPSGYGPGVTLIGAVLAVIGGMATIAMTTGRRPSDLTRTGSTTE